MALLSFLSFPSLTYLLLFLSFWVLLFSPAYSLNCTSQKFTNNKLYANCTDLATLDSYLHYTFNSSNSSLSVAFVAAPAKSDGWTAWGINPNGTGMAGGQVFVAMKSAGGAVAVKTYNLVSYKEIKESNLSFDVWDVSAESESATGRFVIFASVKIPEKEEAVNQIWQVGSSVTDGRPDKHEFAPANLQSKASLALVSSSASSGNTTGGATATNETGAGHATKVIGVGFYFGMSVLIGGFIGML